MNKLLGAGFGYPLPVETLQWIKSLGFTGIRQSLNAKSTLGWRRSLLRQLKDNDMEDSIVGIAEERTDIVPSTIAKFFEENVELAEKLGLKVRWQIGNEPNLHKGLWPGRFAAWLNECNKIAPVIIGGVSGYDDEALKWLQQTLDLIKDPMVVGLHPYRQKERAEKIDLKQVSKFKRLLPSARFVIDEIGWHTAKYPWFLCLKKQWNDRDVYNFAKFELKFWEEMGAEALVWFQLNDGIHDKPESRFGIRTFDLIPKLVSQAFI